MRGVRGRGGWKGRERGIRGCERGVIVIAGLRIVRVPSRLKGR